MQNLTGLLPAFFIIYGLDNLFLKIKLISLSSGRKGTLQLWQFLVALLDDPANANFITWTGRGLEFKLLDPEEVARRWGKMKERFYIILNYENYIRSIRKVADFFASSAFYQFHWLEATCLNLVKLFKCCIIGQI